MIAYWHTGSHPFTGEYTGNVMAVAVGERTTWRGDAELGAVLDLASTPLRARASLDRLLRELQTIR